MKLSVTLLLLMMLVAVYLEEADAQRYRFNLGFRNPTLPKPPVSRYNLWRFRLQAKFNTLQKPKPVSKCNLFLLSVTLKPSCRVLQSLSSCSITSSRSSSSCKLVVDLYNSLCSRARSYSTFVAKFKARSCDVMESIEKKACNPATYSAYYYRYRQTYNTWCYITKKLSCCCKSDESGKADTSTKQPPSTPPSQPPSTPPSQPPSTPPSQPPSTPPSQPASTPPSQPASTPPSQPASTPPSQPPSTPPSQPPSTPPSQPPSTPPSQPPSTPPSQPPSTPPSQPPSTPPSQPPSTPPSTLPPPVDTCTVPGVQQCYPVASGCPRGGEQCSGDCPSVSDICCSSMSPI